MKLLLCHIALLLIVFPGFTQSKREKVPSYFGIQVRPLFPTRFIGNPILTLEQDGFSTTISQKVGYSFGGTVRAGITQLIAIETGINYNQRHFDVTMSLADSNSYAEDQLTFVEYDIPVNALFYIKLSEQWYMNASLGGMITFKPTDIGILNQPGGPHTYRHTGLVRDKFGFDVNANIGFEFRTEKHGFFYLGGSGRVPFAPLFDMVADYTYEGNSTRIVGEVDGSFLAVDFKYFFPIIANKGKQYNKGPVE